MWDIDHQNTLVTEEQFGPVLPILEYESLPELIEELNDQDYGLSGPFGAQISPTLKTPRVSSKPDAYSLTPPEQWDNFLASYPRVATSTVVSGGKNLYSDCGNTTSTRLSTDLFVSYEYLVGTTQSESQYQSRHRSLSRRAGQRLYGTDYPEGCLSQNRSRQQDVRELTLIKYLRQVNEPIVPKHTMSPPLGRHRFFCET